MSLCAQMSLEAMAKQGNKLKVRAMVKGASQNQDQEDDGKLLVSLYVVCILARTLLMMELPGSSTGNHDSFSCHWLDIGTHIRCRV